MQANRLAIKTERGTGEQTTGEKERKRRQKRRINRKKGVQKAEEEWGKTEDVHTFFLACLLAQKSENKTHTRGRGGGAGVVVFSCS